MKQLKISTKTVTLSTILLAATLFLGGITSAPLAMEIPKKVETEFTKLETSLKFFASSLGSLSENSDSTNILIKAFMKDHPMVRKIVRTNADGITKTDLVAGEWSFGPSKNVSSQKWFQFIKETKNSYFSSGDDEEAVTYLFWAWPIFSENNRSKISGVLAAQIDIPTTLALMEQNVPYQMLINSKPFYTQDWEKPDSIHVTTINIKGIENVSIASEVFSKSKPVKHLDSVSATNVSKLADDTTASEKNSAPQKKSLFSGIWLLLTVSALILCIYLLVVKGNAKEIRFRWRDDSKVKNETEHLFNYDNYSVSKPEIIAAPNTDDALDSSGTQTLHHSNLSKNDKFAGQLKPTDNSNENPSFALSGDINNAESEIYAKVYRKLFQEMTQWMVSETERLEKKIDTLNKEIEQIKKNSSD